MSVEEKRTMQWNPILRESILLWMAGEVLAKETMIELWSEGSVVS